jgi:hypothetical protein
MHSGEKDPFSIALLLNVFNHTYELYNIRQWNLNDVGYRAEVVERGGSLVMSRNDHKPLEKNIFIMNEVYQNPVYIIEL